MNKETPRLFKALEALAKGQAADQGTPPQSQPLPNARVVQTLRQIAGQG